MINLDEGCKWDITKVSQRRRVESYSCNSNDIYEDIHYSITVKRNIPTYHSVIIVPGLGTYPRSCYDFIITVVRVNSNIDVKHRKSNIMSSYYTVVVACPHSRGALDTLRLLAAPGIVGEIHAERRHADRYLHTAGDDL